MASPMDGTPMQRVRAMGARRTFQEGVTKTPADSISEQAARELDAKPAAAERPSGRGR